jgi:spore maturation protein CgeB
MTRMKILLVGSDHTWSLERIFVKHLAEEGIDVELFAAQNRFYSYNASLINKFKIRAGLSRIYGSINRELRETITRFRPDIVWVFKGMEVLPDTLRWLRAEGIRTVNFNPDNPFIFTGKGSGNANVTRSIPLYDLHFTYNLEVKRRLEKESGQRTAFLPFGFELSETTFLAAAAAGPEANAVCFLGNPDPQRAAFILGLVKAGLPVDLYGNDWDRFADAAPNLRIFPAVYEEGFWRTLRSYRVQLNLMRIHNLDSHNMRSFEVPGVGGIMLAPATTEHRMFYSNKEEAFLFRDAEEAISMAGELLALDKGEAGDIRQNARLRSINSGYTYLERVRGAIRELRGLYA